MTMKMLFHFRWDVISLRLGQKGINDLQVRVVLDTSVHAFSQYHFTNGNLHATKLKLPTAAVSHPMLYFILCCSVAGEIISIKKHVENIIHKSKN